jgi:mannose-6-phosphate isomerase
MSFQFIETDERPWGRYFVLHDEESYKVKRIEVELNQRLSYQYHFKRAEAWTVVQGEATVTLNGEDRLYKAGETAIIPLQAKHRVANYGTELLVFIEVQTGTYFGEDDIVRVEDDYERK